MFTSLEETLREIFGLVQLVRFLRPLSSVRRLAQSVFLFVGVTRLYDVRCIRFCQELDVHNKKRKSDHQHFLNHHRRRPRDLDHLAVSQSRSFPSQRAASSSSPRDAEFYRGPVADDDEPAAEDYSEATSERGERYEESPVYDNMAGDPARIAVARRGKLVTFYRNGDPHYKVSKQQR